MIEETTSDTAFPVNELRARSVETSSARMTYCAETPERIIMERQSALTGACSLG